MSITQFYIAMAVGLVLSVIIEESIGIVCGGAVVAGYLSMICDDYVSVLIVIVISLITYLIVEFILPKFIIIYGKRKFTACLLVSLIIKLIIDFMVPVFPFATLTFRGVGIIVPGLIANNCAKQGVVITIPAAVLCSFLTYFIVQFLLTWI